MAKLNINRRLSEIVRERVLLSNNEKKTILLKIVNEEIDKYINNLKNQITNTGDSIHRNEPKTTREKQRKGLDLRSGIREQLTQLTRSNWVIEFINANRIHYFLTGVARDRFNFLNYRKRTHNKNYVFYVLDLSDNTQKEVIREKLRKAILEQILKHRI